MRNIILTLSIFLSLFAYGTASAETINLPGTIEAEGTHFAITDSDYLNIALDSSESIDLRLESVPNIITIVIDAATSSATTTITMGGFLPNTTYYKYTDSYHNLTQFTTDTSGAYVYTQDISTHHVIFIQPHKSTKFIRDDVTGGDCISIGTWDSNTKTCALTQNLSETVQIDSDNITLDGNNFTLSGFHTGSGVYLNGRTNVTLKNLQISNFSYGVSAFSSLNNHIVNNTFTNNDYQAIVIFSSSANTITGNTVSLSVPSTNRRQGFALFSSLDNLLENNIINLGTRASNPGHQGILLFSGSNNNNFISNTVSSVYQGILLFNSNNNTLISNSVSNTYEGVLFFTSSNNVVRENMIRESQHTGLMIFPPAIGNQAYNNNFLRNGTQAQNYAGAANVFNHPTPDGGNYWDTFDTQGEGCSDINIDNICDGPYNFYGGQDALPWTTQDGWKSLVNQSPVLSFATDIPEGLNEDDGIQDHKGTAGKTHFTFSVIYTDAQNRMPESVSAAVLPALDVMNPVSPMPIIMTLARDTSTASTTLKDGDYRNGELFAYYHPLSWPKHVYNYSFSVFVGGATTTAPTTSENQFSFKTGYSNVAFLPGLEASRLFRASTSPATQIWDPPTFGNNTQLYLSSNGTSINNDIVTLDGLPEKSVLDEVYGVNVYKNFINFMKDDVVGTGMINEWEALPYDWRLDFPELLKSGNKTGEHVSYLQSTSSPFLIQELHRLASTSDTGKVTIITHSNGGLLAKYLLATLSENNDPLVKKIDTVIMVAAPQLGTPKAIAGLLHGDEANLGAGIILTKQEARTLGENMPSAYNLLPSAQYFNTVQSPVIIFDESVSSLSELYTLASTTIATESTLGYFLRGRDGMWSEPADTDRDTPNVLKDTLLTNAKNIHSTIDAWNPPQGMQVVQIAGWGVDTIKDIRYSCSFLTCHSLSTLDRSINSTTLDGDETVVVPSAVWMSTSTANVERWWVDLEKHNTIFRVNREHASILEVNELHDFIKSIIAGGRTVDGTILTGIRPTATTEDKRLRFTLHSPVDIHLYNSFGDHTGLLPILNSSSTERRSEKNIPNSYYREFGETKYAGVGVGSTTIVALQGLALGSFTFNIEEIAGNDTIVASTTFIDVPVTASTTATMFIPEAGIASTSPALTLDIDGDGITDLTLQGNVNGITEEELTVILKGVIKTLHLPDNKEKQLLKKIDKLAKELSKEHKNEQAEKYKMKDVFKQLLKTIDRYEKKGILTTDEASELRAIVEQIKGSVVL